MNRSPRSLEVDDLFILRIKKAEKQAYYYSKIVGMLHGITVDECLDLLKRLDHTTAILTALTKRPKESNYPVQCFTISRHERLC